MRINVGPFAYHVQLVHGYVRHEGTDCLGLCDNIAQRILISDVPGESQRLQVFFHELMHAWWYHFAVDAADEEAVVDLVGVAMTDFLYQAVRLWHAAHASISEPSPGLDRGTLAGAGVPGVPGQQLPGGAVGRALPGIFHNSAPAGAGAAGVSAKPLRRGRATGQARSAALDGSAAALRDAIVRLLPVLRIEHAEAIEPADKLPPTNVDHDADWVIQIYDRTSVAAYRAPLSASA